MRERLPKWKDITASAHMEPLAIMRTFPFSPGNNYTYEGVSGEAYNYVSDHNERGVPLPYISVMKMLHRGSRNIQ